MAVKSHKDFIEAARARRRGENPEAIHVKFTRSENRARIVLQCAEGSVGFYLTMHRTRLCAREGENPTRNQCPKAAFFSFLLILLTCAPLLAALPPEWTDQDIGSPGLAGSAAYTNGNWTVTGGGSDIWNAADQFNFASTPYMSDGAIVAEVTNLKNSDPSSGWSKAGVMFRNDSTAGSVNVAMVVSAAEGVNFQWRSSAGGQSANHQGSGGC